MKDLVSKLGGGMVWQKGHERLWLVPWGKNGIRVRATAQGTFPDMPQALLPQRSKPRATVSIDKEKASLRNGMLVAEVNQRGELTFLRQSDGHVLLQECTRNSSEHLGRNLTPCGSHWKLEQRFFAQAGEKLFGLGQHQHGFLDQKGCTIELLQRNMEVNIPFLMSNRGYGFLWNHPGTGRADLGRNETRWTADMAQLLDYYVVEGQTPAEILERYTEVTGKPTPFPEWGSGFWQCKLRYKTQKEVMKVAREYKRRKLPISVIIIDFHHWTQMGDWKFDPKCFPNPRKMVQDLKKMGIKVMVSIWPTVSLTSENFKEMNKRGLLLRTDRGRPILNTSSDTAGSEMQCFYDSTHPEARDLIMDRVHKNYSLLGIKLFWLDTMEPEVLPLEQDNTRYHLGPGSQVSCLYPLMHQQAFYEGLKKDGEKEILTLGRSAWAGSQRYGAAVWSADIVSTFDSLRRQVTGGLNIGLSGIPWWTTDIGGFKKLDIDDPAGRELLVRWFQFGVFCPITRLHGVRHKDGLKPDEFADNEVWSYGPEAYEILKDMLALREKLRPYIHKCMKQSEKTGAPLMRPLFFDFPDDEPSWSVEDQYMFGPEILVAPITSEQTFRRSVYLPAGKRWRHAWSGVVLEGGQTVEVEAPLEQIPFFLTEESKLDLVEPIPTETKRLIYPAPRNVVQDVPRRDLWFSQDFTPEELRKRRKRVAKEIGKNAHALVLSAPPVAGPRPIQDAAFYYLAGLEVTHSIVMIEGGSGKTTLFIPEGKESGEPPEDALGVENARLIKKKWLIDAVEPVEALKKHLRKLGTVYTPHAPVEGGGANRYEWVRVERQMNENPWDRAEPRNERFRRILSELAPEIEFKDLLPVLLEMRSVKSPAEIEVMRQAGRLSACALIEAIKATRPGSTETQLQAIAEYTYRQMGHCSKSYGITVASGLNTWDGHYNRNNETLKAGDVVLMDCGPDLRHYTTDMARVWPVSGTYTPWQRTVYGLVCEYHKVLLDLVTPGAMVSEIYKEADKRMRKLVRQKSWPYGKEAKAMVERMIKRGVGYLNHGVGLSVHDAIPGFREKPLEVGMVFVIDPMIWCDPEHQYIRVEDTIVVTRDGCERLTGDTPFEPHDIEALMRESSNFPL